MKTSSELLGRHFDQTLNRWRREKMGEGSQPAPFSGKLCRTIAISRETGAGGGDIGREVAARLGWEVYDRQLIETIANDRGIRAELLESVDERRSHWLVECLEVFLGVPTVSADSYACHLAKVMVALAAHGDCVLVGRGAAALLPSAATLRVRIVAALQDRIERTAKKLGVTKQQAAQHVESTDRQRVEFVQKYFHKDPNDTRQYDLIINTSRFFVRSSAELIIDALRLVQSQD